MITNEQETIAKTAQACDRELNLTAHAGMNRLCTAQLATAGANDLQRTVCISDAVGASEPHFADFAGVVEAKDAQVSEDGLDELRRKLWHRRGHL